MNSIQRLRLLRDSGVISDDIETVLELVLAWLSNRGVPVDSENGQMFITHLAMAVRRAKTAETVLGLPEEILRQAEESPHYPVAREFISFLDSLEVSLPDSEKGYVTVHICSLLEGGEGVE